MLASGMKTLDNRTVFFGCRTFGEPGVDGPIAHAHLVLIRLAVEQAGGRRLVDDASGRAEVFKECKDLCRGQIGDGIEITGAVTPFREITHIGFTAVAGAGDQSSLGRSDGIKRRHAKPRRDVGNSKVSQLAHALQGLELRGTDGGQVNGSGLDMILLGQFTAVAGIDSEISL